MNRFARMLLQEDHSDRRDYGRGEYRGTMQYGGDYADREMDGRRGVKGTGRYGIGGSRYYRDRRDYAEDMDRRDYRDYGDMADQRMDRRDYRDYAEDGGVRLSPKEMKEWKKNLKNADNMVGERFTEMDCEKAADKADIHYAGYSPDDLCMTMNMLYSDYCEVTKGLISSDREPEVYAKMAKAFLEDKDSSTQGAEKLYLYYKAIAADE